jgi:hypothetical protein
MGSQKGEILSDMNFSPLTIATMFDGTTVVTFTPNYIRNWQQSMMSYLV